ncbi:MarR family winged helix-turn-helix transcriptional regulator [uncultured Dysosmobacter sp.]|uniref:MarR family winged helix-turn-helix transcriptional regulator n=1 Tax=uncultured Dysosmobacter sp. TaxID=2591384 RepID=UPI00263854F6|nr:helix-turn-helix domain-containing protein [uncultured Dysosmobacter sp.]
MHIRQQMEQLCACFCRQEELYREWAKAHSMSYNEVMTLYALDLGRSYTQKQICEEWLIPKQTLNTIVKDLERKGCVCMESLPGKREKTVRFTERGHAYAGGHLRELYQMEERAMAALDGDMRRAVVEGAQRFTEAFAQEVRRG